MILPDVRDPRLITVRRGGTLTDSDHHLLARWASDCAEHVLHLFEQTEPGDPRPRQAIEQIRAWTRGEIRMWDSRSAGGHAMAAARPLSGAPRFAAFAAGQAIKAVRAAEDEAAGREECRWQRAQLPDPIRALVLEDQQRRNEICWSVFD